MLEFAGKLSIKFELLLCEEISGTEDSKSSVTDISSHNRSSSTNPHTVSNYFTHSAFDTVKTDCNLVKMRETNHFII